MLELIASTQAAGFFARYVLFDRWYSSPKTLISLTEEYHMDTIVMTKKNKAKYLYKGQSLNIKQIYSKNRKQRGCSKYLLSVDVTLKKDGGTLPGRIVCVHNKSNRKDWLPLPSTDMNVLEEEITHVYEKSWAIELFFKCCKSYLKLVKECRSISYDALNAHVAIVFTRYVMLSLAKRHNEDDKTI